MFNVAGALYVLVIGMPWVIASASATGLNDEPGWRPPPPPSVPTARFTCDVLKSLPPTITFTRPWVSRATIDAAGSVGWLRLPAIAAYAAFCIPQSIVV